MVTRALITFRVGYLAVQFFQFLQSGGVARTQAVCFFGLHPFNVQSIDCNIQMSVLVDFLHYPSAVENMHRNTRPFGKLIFLVCTVLVSDELVREKVDTFVVATGGQDFFHIGFDLGFPPLLGTEGECPPFRPGRRRPDPPPLRYLLGDRIRFGIDLAVAASRRTGLSSEIRTDFLFRQFAAEMLELVFLLAACQRIQMILKHRLRKLDDIVNARVGKKIRMKLPHKFPGTGRFLGIVVIQSSNLQASASCNLPIGSERMSQRSSKARMLRLTFSLYSARILPPPANRR